MTRRLALLNLALLALCGWSGWRLQTRLARAEAAQERFLRATAPAKEPLPPSLPEPPAPVQPAKYLEVAQELLFSTDRNPDVIVEVVQPKPLPPLPRFHGLFSLGGPPRALLSHGQERQKSYAVGDQVGEYKLVALTQAGLVFEWEGKKVAASFAELRVKEEASAPAPAAPAPSAPPSNGNVSTVAPVQTVSNEDLARPGEVVNENMRTCQPGDKTPAGTVVQGFRKVLKPTPFGNQCWWERVQ